MHFVNYDVCLNGKWESKTCEKGSLFWVVTDCCIPIEKYPTLDNCIQIKEDSNQNEITKAPYRRKLRSQLLEITSKKPERHDSEEIGSKNPLLEITSKKPERHGSEEIGSKNPLSIDMDNLDTDEEEPYESEETSNNQSSDNSEDEPGGNRHEDNKGT